VVLTVGDRKFTAAEFESLLSGLPPQYQALGRKGFAGEYANLLSLVMEGEKRQLDQSDEFRRMLDFNRQVLLAQLVMSKLAEQYGSVGPEEVNYFYQTHQQDFEQAKVTGIFVPFAAPGGSSSGTRTTSAMPQLTEQQAMTKALQLRARIQSGQDMAALAKTESQHPTAAKGGDFGYIARNAQGGPLPQGLVTAIFALQPTRVSAPLREGNGLFLFRMEEKRIQPLEELQAQIQAILGREKLGRHLEVLKESYPVTLHPGYFAEAPAAAPPAQPR
jgi:peptidyl-prolyl cis-trans isomerase C